MLLLTPHSVPDPTQLPAHPALGFALSRAASECHVTPSQSWEQLFGTVKVFLCCVVSVPTGLQVSVWSLWWQQMPPTFKLKILLSEQLREPKFPHLFSPFHFHLQLQPQSSASKAPRASHLGSQWHRHSSWVIGSHEGRTVKCRGQGHKHLDFLSCVVRVALTGQPWGSKEQTTPAQCSYCMQQKHIRLPGCLCWEVQEFLEPPRFPLNWSRCFVCTRSTPIF